jgi:hypothetical protein
MWTTRDKLEEILDNVEKIQNNKDKKVSISVTPDGFADSIKG